MFFQGCDLEILFKSEAPIWRGYFEKNPSFNRSEIFFMIPETLPFRKWSFRYGCILRAYLSVVIPDIYSKSPLSRNSTDSTVIQCAFRWAWASLNIRIQVRAISVFRHSGSLSFFSSNVSPSSKTEIINLSMASNLRNSSSISFSFSRRIWLFRIKLPFAVFWPY